MDDEIQRRIGEMEPIGTWTTVGRAAGVDVWRVTDSDWDLDDPPEDLALPPMLPWSEKLRELVIKSYKGQDPEFAAGELHCEVSWPPDGSLWTPGYWCWEDLEECSEHGMDYSQECSECKGLDQEPRTVVEQQARWDWTVDVEVYDRELLDDGREVGSLVDNENSRIIGSTYMDPREVEFGPHRGNPDRQSLYLQRSLLGDGAEATDQPNRVAEVPAAALTRPIERT